MSLPANHHPVNGRPPGIAALEELMYWQEGELPVHQETERQTRQSGQSGQSDRETDTTAHGRFCLSVTLSPYLTAALDLAKRSPMPPAAGRYQLPQMRLLVSICAMLQEQAGDGPFHLSCRAAGALLGVTHKLANGWLWRLVHDEVLAIAKAGTQGPGGRATRYRYLAGQTSSSRPTIDDPGPYEERF